MFPRVLHDFWYRNESSGFTSICIRLHLFSLYLESIKSLTLLKETEKSDIHTMHADNTTFPSSLRSRIRASYYPLALGTHFSFCLSFLLYHRGLTSKNYISQTLFLLELDEMRFCQWDLKGGREAETIFPEAVVAYGWASVYVCFSKGKNSTVHYLLTNLMRDVSWDFTHCKNCSGAILSPTK